MFCRKCGNEVQAGQIKCPKCGEDLSYSRIPNAPYTQGPYGAPNVPYRPSEPVNAPNAYIKNYKPKLGYNPIGMWGYFGFNILFMIPVVGFICVLLFSFGVSKNANIRNYARSYLCIYIIAAVILLVFGVILGMLW